MSGQGCLFMNHQLVILPSLLAWPASRARY